MKNLNISLGIIVVAFFSILFTSCDKEEFEVSSEPEIAQTEPDTITVDKEFVYRLNDEEQQLFNGASFSCLDNFFETEKFFNFIAYGEDLQIIDDVAVFEKDVFTLSWITDTQFEKGEFLASGTIERIDGSSITTVVRLKITSFTQELVFGTLNGEFEDDTTGESIKYTGSFNLENYKCETFGDNQPSLDDDEILVNGTMDVQLETDDPIKYSSIIIKAGDEIYEDLEGDKYFQFIGSGFTVNEYDGVEFLEELQYFAYHREVNSLELNNEYAVNFGLLDDEISDNLIDGEDYLMSVSEELTVVYTELNDKFYFGEIYGTFNGRPLKASFRSQIVLFD